MFSNIFFSQSHPRKKPVNTVWRSKTLSAAVLYFALVFGAGFLLGSVRVPFVAPRIGERYAELIEMPFMFVAIYFASRYVLRRFGPRTDSAGLIGTGIIALLLLIGAELLLAVLLAGRGIVEYISSRDPVSGSVYLLMLLLFAAMPWLQARRAMKAPPAASQPSQVA